MAGILTIWNNCRTGRENAYDEWYQGEHLIERLRVSGFRIGRRYEAIAARRRFMTTYEVRSPQVFESDGYQELLRYPTELTAAMMKDGFIDMRRTICKREHIRGAFRGGVVVTAAAGGAEPVSLLQEWSDRFQVNAELVHSEI